LRKLNAGIALNPLLRAQEKGAPAAGVIAGIYSGLSIEKTECWYCSKPAAAIVRERSSCSRCSCRVQSGHVY